MANFKIRMYELLNGRKQTPWGKSMGFSGGSISSIFGGRIPGSKFLGPISELENVNLNWLLLGKGAKYNVEYKTPRELSNDLKDLLDSYKWTLFVCSTVEDAVFVAVRIEENKPLPSVRVIYGHSGNYLTQVLTPHPNRDSIKIPFLDNGTANRIAKGEFGAYELAASPDSILKVNRVAKDADLIFCSGLEGQNEVQFHTLKAVVEEVELFEKASKQPIQPEQKSRVISAVYRQAARAELTRETIASIVETTFDVLKD
ncbi:TPA: hypothetical protein PMB08_002792 [Vibrio cholerae]|uniref:hypothetical protein n=1 Tax=Vibrio cholerae TaxID=666 RepID=UPI00285D4185|nr:hypothetical protein [Vibrio cholerae]ELD8764131.1 hypothetical protein [Vibrio cholerae]ELJ8681792.1 hypothetical protein [Vibrio cholerae]ELT5927357.1 hypothetical protein [Vibrio cholerae]ELY5265503.1 hypothetical protein [Vibrio cholerae]